MKLATTPGMLGLIALAALASPCAMADETADEMAHNTGWYMGANIGQSRAKIDDARITSGLQQGGLSTSSITDRDRDLGYKIFGGYQLNKNFALEGGYFDLGKFGFTANTLPAGTLDGNIKLRGLNLDLVGTLPITTKFSVLGRAGVNYAEAKDSFSGTGAVLVANPNPTKRDTNYKFGLGLQYAFNDSVAMRTEVERYRINDAVGNKGDVDLLSVGLVYRFGAKTPAPVAREIVAVAPVQRIVETPPQLAPVPVRAMPKKVSFSADAMYAFDKADLNPAGKEMLDGLTRDLEHENYNAIVLTGNADRIGRDEYNQELSERRAESVKTYLVSKGIPADRLHTLGNGETQSETKPGDCEGAKSKSIIACLQPDRRVDVEMTGTVK